ncbi:MAG TPA: TIR domain-containing protein [Sphingomicrobium sp.]|nr:TIR domain-containing protein [Sphingomicrobium sp.]
MPGTDIFISYSREDRAAARYFAECFGQEGFNVWWDAALHSGETFDEVIEKELKASKAVVVLWSPRSVTSRWVRAEATLADRRNKLAPVIIEACDRPIIFELHHTVDLADWTGDTTDPRWKGFIHDLHRIIEKNAPAQPAATAPSAERFRSDRISGSADTPMRRRDVESMFGGAAGRAEARAPTPAPKPQPTPAPAPAPGIDDDDDDDEAQATQFYTKLDGVDLFGNDQFHCLEVSDESGPGQHYVVSPVGLKIGRSPPADIVLADPRVSRSHCTVELAGDDLKVTDLKSTNGTYIDGERVEGVAMLPVGSLLRVGNICFRHEIRTRAEV